MSRTFWCKNRDCGAVREVEINADGYFHPPQSWHAVFLHESDGTRRSIANFCSTYCCWKFLTDMPVGEHLTAPDRSAAGKSWGCRKCNARYTSEFIRSGSISVAEFEPGRRWIGMFCDSTCAAAYMEDTIAELMAS
jgi:hypothetical protein